MMACPRSFGCVCSTNQEPLAEDVDRPDQVAIAEIDHSLLHRRPVRRQGRKLASAVAAEEIGEREHVARDREGDREHVIARYLVAMRAVVVDRRHEVEAGGQKRVHLHRHRATGLRREAAQEHPARPVDGVPRGPGRGEVTAASSRDLVRLLELTESRGEVEKGDPVALDGGPYPPHGLRPHEVEVEHEQLGTRIRDQLPSAPDMPLDLLQRDPVARAGPLDLLLASGAVGAWRTVTGGEPPGDAKQVRPGHQRVQRPLKEDLGGAEMLAVGDPGREELVVGAVRHDDEIGT